jgi:hypothetical protein
MGLFLKEAQTTRQSSGDDLLEEREAEPRSGLWQHVGSFLHGMGSVLELFPPPPVLRLDLLRDETRLRPRPEAAPPPLDIPRQTSAEALRGDWQRIGDDLHRALERVRAGQGRD